ncbi:MAG: hypothetical protein NC321_09580 [Clostridium sp.]|nr:hypothetical protein [Clostridium sp.]
MGKVMMLGVMTLLLHTAASSMTAAEYVQAEAAFANADAKIQEALTAYQEYIDGHVEYLEEELEAMDFCICSLFYLDDDEIPECYFDAYFSEKVLLRYQNGEIWAYASDDWGSCNFPTYQEKTGRFRYTYMPGSRRFDVFLELADNEGGFIETGFAVRSFGGQPDCAIGGVIKDGMLTDGTDVDIDTYNEYIASFGEYESMPRLSAGNVKEAYRDLLAR